MPSRAYEPLELDAEAGFDTDARPRAAGAGRPPRRTRAAAGCLGGAAAAAAALLLAAHALLGGGRGGGGGGADGCSWSQYTLPADGPTPAAYDVALRLLLPAPFAPPNNSSPRADGAVSVTLRGGAADARCVVLHAAEGLRVASVRTAAGREVAWERSDAHADQLILHAPVLAGEEAVLTVRYSLALEAGLAGLYLSDYAAPAGSAEAVRYLAATQFEATDARAMLPCMDEPRFKAAFRVSLDVPAAAVALSNGAVRARAPYVAAQAAATYGEAAAAAGEGSRFEGLEYETVAFSATPPMATYLLAIAVGELVGTTVQVPSAPLGEAGGEVNVTVWCVPMGDAAERAARVEALSTARDTAAAILPAYAGLFGQPFPLAKLDLLALPEFAAGAMENWGLITFRETAMLSPAREVAGAREEGAWAQERVVVVVAHEIAHQWFGDLVTMKWWDGLWLNEGFASYVEHIGTNIAKPAWNFLSEGFFYATTLRRALALDALASSHAIQADDYTIRLNGDIDALFDGVSYDKGGSLIRMARLRMAGGACRNTPYAPLEDELAAECPQGDPFLVGLREYVDTHAYSSASTEDLWAALASAPCLADGTGVECWTGSRLLRAMRGWTTRKGYPLVRVTALPGGSYAAKQAHFHAADGADFSSPLDEPWVIPIRVRSSYLGREEPVYARDLDTASSGDHPIITLPEGSEGSWAFFNADGVGIYHTQYEAAARDALIAASSEGGEYGGLTAGDVASFVFDLDALVSAGMEAGDVLLDAVEAAAARRPLEYPVWSTLYGVLGSLSHRLEVACRDAVNIFVARQGRNQSLSGLVSGQARHTTRRALPLAVELAGLAGDAQTVDNSTRLLAAEVWNGTEPLPDVQSAVYLIAARGAAAASDPDAAIVPTRDGLAVSVWSALSALHTASSRAGNARKASALLDALCAAGRGWTSRSLSLSLSDDVRAQDSAYVVRCVAGAGAAERDVAWDFLMANWDALNDKAGGAGAAAGGLASLFDSVASGFLTSARKVDVIEAFARHPDADIGLHRTHALESIDDNVRWLKRNADTLCTRLGG